ncbi:hypothetical protein N7456_011525 [Penicillium angulare]|uniref:Uncharacterized protein n=1 Tax=Penicillium angulare TaxID=116970 RepID=A0A9W9EU11_9EURO|nr:hypothetical protein N7456_011525 [Penicillium angulare]
MYSAPLISEEVAVKCLHQVSIKDLGFLYSCLDIYPEHSEVILKLADLVQRAVQIYLARASKAPDDDISILVQLFLIEASLFNAASPGGHILIWPFFIVGAECSLEEDRDFVTEQLKSLWRFTGFGNTLYAIELLNKIWHGEYGGCWTEVLGEKVQGFIM